MLPAGGTNQCTDAAPGCMTDSVRIAAAPDVQPLGNFVDLGGSGGYIHLAADATVSLLGKLLRPLPLADIMLQISIGSGIIGHPAHRHLRTPCLLQAAPDVVLQPPLPPQEPTEPGPVFVPIVLTMDGADHEPLLQEWYARQQVRQQFLCLFSLFSLSFSKRGNAHATW